MNIKIESLDHQARGIAHIDGKVVFIPGALPNETVQIAITENKKNYCLGKIINIIEEAANRQTPKCPYYEQCGGCHTSHMEYETSLDFKKNTLINILSKYAGLNINPSIIKSKPYNYRNKIALKVANYKWGYYSSKTHHLIEINNCLLAKESINNIINQKEFIRIKNGEITIRTNYNDEILIIINTKSKVNIELDKLKANNKIVGIIVNDKTYYGENNFIEIIDNKYYAVDYNSFFQVNIEPLSEIFKILNYNEYQNILDLYCGVGLLGLSIKAKQVYGIEISPSGIKNALFNAKTNHQEAFYLLGDSSKIKEIKASINTIIIDPPRTGISNETIENIIKRKPQDIIYMSCNPITLARDLNKLKQHYELDYIYLIDMFPQTYHIECLVKLIKK